MAWNEPGGDKDPWNGRGDKGPPDLDEVVRKLQKSLGGIFGGGKRSKGDSGGGIGGFGAGIIGIAIFVALGLWLASGIYIVQEGTRGVELRFGKYLRTTLPGPHWHFPTPFETAEVVDVENQRLVPIGYRTGGQQNGMSSVPREALMLTQDSTIVDLHLAVQYQISDPKDYLFSVRDPDLTLKQAAESAIREVVGHNEMDFVLREGREQIVSDTQRITQSILDQYKTGLNVINVTLRDVQPPDQVQDAYTDVTKAREDRQRLINEAEAYENSVVPLARGEAARKLAEAEAYKAEVVARSEGDAKRFTQQRIEFEKAPEITRKRLHLEAMQNVLSNTRKVMMDVDSGNSLFYLPLDRMIPGSAGSSSAGGGASGVPADSGSDSANRQRSDTRRRAR